MKTRYKIPVNFLEAGYVFRGLIPLRNAIDAAVFALIGYFVASIFAPKDFWDGIGWYIFFVFLFGYIGIIGIQGVPFSVYLFDLIQWLRRRNPYLYNHHGAAYTASAADVMLEAPQIRDHIAAVVDAIREKLAPAPAPYVEGETFQFAEDPEMEYLKNAERAAEKEAENIANEAPAISSPEEYPDSDSSDTLDFDNIIENITLTDSEVTE